MCSTPYSPTVAVSCVGMMQVYWGLWAVLLISSCGEVTSDWGGGLLKVGAGKDRSSRRGVVGGDI